MAAQCVLWSQCLIRNIYSSITRWFYCWKKTIATKLPLSALANSNFIKKVWSLPYNKSSVKKGSVAFWSRRNNVHWMIVLNLFMDLSPGQHPIGYCIGQQSVTRLLLALSVSFLLFHHWLCNTTHSFQEVCRRYPLSVLLGKCQMHFLWCKRKLCHY